MIPLESLGNQKKCFGVIEGSSRTLNTGQIEMAWTKLAENDS